MFWKKKRAFGKVDVSQKKSVKRIEQEKMLRNWKIKLEKVSIPELETKLYTLEKKMNQYCFKEFDSDIQKIADLIEHLPDTEWLLFNQEMGYKFSKSKKEFAEYFSEGWYINYPEMSYVEAEAGAELSFTLGTDNLLYCAMYGDQLTQIPLNIEHPYYNKLSNAQFKYKGMIFGEYCGNILLTGMNISLKDPYVLKHLIKVSSDLAICNFVRFSYVNKRGENLGQVYRKIGFEETADFYFDIKKWVDKGKTAEIKGILDEIFPDNGNNVLNSFYESYMEQCRLL